MVLAAIGWGQWQALEASLADGLARVAYATREGELPDERSIGAAIVAYRRARGLLAAEEYLAWLAERSLSTDDMNAFLVRRLLGERAAADLVGGDSESAEPGEIQPSPAEPLSATLRAEAILSRSLDSWAERLVRSVAASHALAADGREPEQRPTEASALVEQAAELPRSGLSRSDARERAPRVAALIAAELAFRGRASSSQALERCLAEHHLDWQRLTWREALFASEGAAREALMWIADEGMALEEVATLARAETSTREAYSGELPDLAPHLLAAVPGDVVGPLPHDAGWRLLCLLDRVVPNLQDPTLRERAGGEVLDRALRRHLAGRVSWHGGH